MLNGLVLLLALLGGAEKSVVLPVAGAARAGDASLYPVSATTPGKTSTAVTQANLKQTICKSGYTNTVRPTTTLTNQLKDEQVQQLRLPFRCFSNSCGTYTSAPMV